MNLGIETLLEVQLFALLKFQHSTSARVMLTSHNTRSLLLEISFASVFFSVTVFLHSINDIFPL